MVHRLQPERASNRLELKFDFTAGSNILLNCENIGKCLQSNFDLESLSATKREILKGIFPKRYHVISEKSSFSRLTFLFVY